MLTRASGKYLNPLMSLVSADPPDDVVYMNRYMCINVLQPVQMPTAFAVRLIHDAERPWHSA